MKLLVDACSKLQTFICSFMYILCYPPRASPLESMCSMYDDITLAITYVPSGVDELIRGCQIGTESKNKLLKVIDWAKRSGLANLEVEYNSHEVLSCFIASSLYWYIFREWQVSVWQEKKNTLSRCFSQDSWFWNLWWYWWLFYFMMIHINLSSFNSWCRAVSEF